ncbi:MAG: DUF5020 family protein [Bacteroidaceae bacterium]|nr:DUF5020 family protein [Bacteroidaceae bacterium]
MKKILFMAMAFIAAISANAQDIQLHYDFGRNIYPNEEAGRPKVTMTVEHFNTDQWGSWFYFVDVDFSRKFTEGAYTEVSREFNLGKQSPFAAHIEYNGGLNRFGSFQQSALVGPAWNGHSEDFSKTYSVQLMYKQFFKSYNDTRAYASFQLTGVWSTTFASKACTFSGFIDFWRGEQANGHGQLVILAEPQFWYNLNSIPSMKSTNLSIGTEVRISNNFIYNPYSDKSFFVNPTLALKWTF